MEPTKFGRIVLFLLSYYILFVFLIWDYEGFEKTVNFRYFNLSWSGIIIIVLTLMVFSMSMYLFNWRSLPKKVFEVTSVKNVSTETLTYLITIIMGLLFFSRNVSGFKLIVLLVLLFLVYQAGGIYYLQPLLIPFGYKVYKCTIDGNNEIMVISRTKPLKEKKEFKELFEDAYIIRGDKQ